ncbi:SET domain protein [Spraguea lophii 42_110]|uniref:SET domain protein n=1 Tax=Spraguea lophii (strain 42_110) TaxID=1358809 RepID=S7W635_SPRLO|nr:SET domain protein [Spraguea lophii 42_110]
MIWTTHEQAISSKIFFEDFKAEWKVKYLLDNYKNLDDDNFLKVSKIVFGKSRFLKQRKNILQEYFLYQLEEIDPSVLLGTIGEIIPEVKEKCKFCKKEKNIECKGHVEDYCPLCYQNYNPNDYEIKMMECSSCQRWIHFNCDNKITEEEYENLENTFYECEICTKSKNMIENMRRYKTDAYNSCFACKMDIDYSLSDVGKIIEIKNYKPTVYGHAGCILFNKNTKNYTIYSLKAGKCIKCHKDGATISCVICDKGPYHLYCSFNTLIFSDLTIPSCKSHLVHNLIEYTTEIDGSELPMSKDIALIDKKIIYLDKEWYLRNIFRKGENEIIEYKEGSYYLNGIRTETENILKRFSIQNIDMANFYIFKTFGLSFHLFKKEIKLREKQKLKQKELSYDINSRSDYGEEYLPRRNYIEPGHCDECNIYSLVRNHTLTQTISHVSEENCILRKSSVEGFGLFADKNFIRNEPIIIYYGEEIIPEEANRREKIYDKNRCYFFTVDKNTIIDATVKSNLAKYINHSCNPNCFSTLATSGTWNGVIICAKRNILKGEELTYDYYFTGGTEKVKCLCGELNCREYIN